jgi:D-amino-acid dehydrogenase
MYDAIVVGGGVVGVACAYHLVGQGARTLLIDRRDPGQATDAGAGILAPKTSSREAEVWFRFGVEAFAYYPALIAQLQTEQVGETGYARCGELIVAVTEDELEPFDQARRLIFAWQQRRGAPAPADLHPVSSEQARELFPALAPVLGAIYYRQAARVDGRLLVQALRRAAERRGLVVRQASVDRLSLKGSAIAGVMVGGETLAAGKVAIAGGAWSQAFGDQLGVEIPVEPQRGQIIHLKSPAADTATWPIVSAFRGHYIVPWPDSRVVVGATRESGTGFKPHPTAAGVREVLSEALRVAPGLGQMAVEEIRVGLRPLTPDGLPVLGPVPGVNNVYLATGHGPSGLLLGPYSGKIVAELMLGREFKTGIDAFQVGRFHHNTDV